MGVPDDFLAASRGIDQATRDARLRLLDYMAKVDADRELRRYQETVAGS
jgi:hypothetical protein